MFKLLEEGLNILLHISPRNKKFTSYRGTIQYLIMMQHYTQKIVQNQGKRASDISTIPLQSLAALT